MRHDHFAGIAADYAAHRPVYPRALVDYLAELTPSHTLSWEAGCGSGQLSTVLAQRFERVFASDAGAQQLAHARRHPRVEYRCEPAEACSLAAGAADLAVAAQAAHWFDLPAYYREVRRVLRSGGVVALVTYGNVRIAAEMDAIVAHFYATALRPYWPAERRYVEDGYASLPFPFDEIAVPALELRAEWTLPELLGYIATWSAVGRLVRGGGTRAIAALQRELAAAWGNPAARRVVRWPLTVRAGYVGVER